MGCLGNKTYVGTRGGLYYSEGTETGNIRHFAGLPSIVVKSISTERGNLLVGMGNLTDWEIGPDGRIGKQPTKPGIPDEAPADGIEHADGFPVTGRASLGGKRYAGTMGAGLLVELDEGFGQVAGSPSEISGICADGKGGVLLAAKQGLFRFDGSKIERLMAVNCPDCQVNSVVFFRDHALAGTLTGGVIRALDCRPAFALEGPARRINSFLIHGDELLVGTDAGIFSWDGGELRKRDEIVKGAVGLMAVSGNRFWCMSGSGLKCLESGTWRWLREFKMKGTVMIDRGGVLYLGGIFGLWSVDRDFSRNRTLHQNVTALSLRDDILLAATLDEGIWAVPIGGSPAKVFPGNFTAVTFGKRGIWMGTPDQGLYFSPNLRTRPIRIASKNIGSKCITALAARNGELIVGTTAGAYVVME